jgi:putative ABC transport system permease protein
VTWLRQLFARRRRYHELSQSIREHLDETIEELVDNGMSREEVSSVTTVQEQLLQQLAPRRFQTFLLGIFSLLALVLATIGIYGLIHYSIVQRTREICIRMALGAQRGDILLAVIKRGLLLGGIGLAIGLMVDWVSTRLLSRLLYGVAPSDPVTLSTVSLLLIGAALLASLIPALPAVRVDPMQTLRSE